MSLGDHVIICVQSQQLSPLSRVGGVPFMSWTVLLAAAQSLFHAAWNTVCTGSAQWLLRGMAASALLGMLDCVCGHGAAYALLTTERVEFTSHVLKSGWPTFHWAVCCLCQADPDWPGQLLQCFCGHSPAFSAYHATLVHASA